jgi:hypothetical protein
MQELYTELGLIEFTINELESQLILLKEQKTYLIKTISNANQNLHPEKSIENSNRTESETQ